MSDQHGFPTPFGDDSATGGTGMPDGPRGTRGRTIAIIVLAVLVAALIVAVLALVFANGATPAPTPSPTVTTDTPTPTPTATPTPTSGAAPTCTVNDLTVTLGSYSGAAGSTYVPILFKNTSAKPCELHGFPGVSFVGKGNGTQLGAAADWDQSKPIVQNTLQPSSVVAANLRIAQAGNYDSGECQPLAADGFRVYPPHSTKAVFVQAANLTACQSDKVHLLMVTSPVAPQ